MKKLNYILANIFWIVLTTTVIAQEKPAIYLSISHEVADYNDWKVGFDNHISVRAAAGLRDVFVKQEIDNTNTVTAFFRVINLEKAQAFLADPALKEAMSKAGVVSTPEIAFYNLEEEYCAINPSALVTLITNPVTDFSSWKVVHQSAEYLRKNAGITDCMLLRSLANENVITILGTSSSVAKFNEFMQKVPSYWTTKSPDPHENTSPVIVNPETKILF